MLRLARSCKIDFLICSESVNSSQPGHSRGPEPVEAPGEGKGKGHSFRKPKDFQSFLFCFVFEANRKLE